MKPEHPDRFQIPQGWLPPPSEPGVIASFCGWHLTRFLGMGGMGVVLLARSDQNKSDFVAMKLLRPELQTNGDAVKKFQRETNLVSRMDHPHILRARQVDEAFGLQFFVMPYMQGGNLSEYVRKHSLNTKAIQDLMINMANALSYCHVRGIIHRDIKPSNILFDLKGHPYLTDFGLASTAASDSFIDPATARPRGTAAYLSPKMAKGEMDDTRGDIYSLGAVLYELLAGQPPYQGSCSKDILDKILQTSPAPLNEVNPQANPVLIRIANRAMARDLKDRYAEMSDMVKDLIEKTPNKIRSNSNQSFHSNLKGSQTSLAQPDRRKVLIITVILICILLPGLVFLFKPKFILTKETLPLSNTPWHGGIIAKWSLDGKPRIIHYANHDGKLTILNEDGTIYSDSKILSSQYEKFQLLQASDILGDKREELIFRWNKGDHAGISIFNQGPTERKRFSLPGSKLLTIDSPEFLKILEYKQQLGEDTTGKEQSIFEDALADRKPFRNQIQWHGVHDLDLDEKKEVLISLNTGYELKPRKLVCMDLETGNTKWEQSSGPMLRNAFVFSRAEENKPALIAVSGDAPNNGAFGADGISDAFPHLYLFDGFGNRLWSRQVSNQSEVYVRPKIIYFDNQKTPAIMAFSLRPSYNPIGNEVGSVLLFDIHGNLISNRGFNRAVSDQYVVGTHPEDETINAIGMFTNDATFHILDQQLKSIRTVILGESNEIEYLTKVITFDDLNGDQKKEWLLLTFENERMSEFNGKGHSNAPTEFQRGNIQLHVVSKNGKLKAQKTIHRHWKHEFNFKVGVYPGSPNQPKNIYFMGHNLKKYQFR